MGVIRVWRLVCNLLKFGYTTSLEYRSGNEDCVHMRHVLYMQFLYRHSAAVLRIRIRIRSDPGFLGHPDPDPDPGKKFTDPDPDPSSTIIFKSQNNGI